MAAAAHCADKEAVSGAKPRKTVTPFPY